YFGKYPDADGTTVGKTLDGTPIPLTPAPDVPPTSITHGYWSGLFSIAGGRMAGYSTLLGGEQLQRYTPCPRASLAHYFHCADRPSAGSCACRTVSPTIIPRRCSRYPAT